MDVRYPADNQSHKLWWNLNFPLFYQVDILFVLSLLAELDSLDRPGAGPALDWLRDQRDLNGHWKSANPYASQNWKVFTPKVERNRWVSLHAARVLSRVR